MLSPPRCCCSTRSVWHRDMQMLMLSRRRPIFCALLLTFAVSCSSGSPGRAVRVVVPPGATLAQAGDSLEKSGVKGTMQQAKQ